jgi:hypothetical protein
MVVAVFCVALLGVLLFGLGMTVSLMRGKYKQLGGLNQDPAHPLHKLVRAHGNTAEYAPFLAVLILYLGSQNPGRWVLALMIAATLMRFLLVLGLLLSDTLVRAHPLRFIGALGTYIFGIGLCAAAILSV